MSSISEFVEDTKSQAVDELSDLLRIPSVSTVSAHDSDCRHAAEWIEQYLKRLNFSRTELKADENHPVVWGVGPNAPGKPTVLVYGHYDVQPADPLSLWESDPFTPTVRDGKLYARGVSDDKGQVVAVLKGFEAAVRNGEVPVNLRVLIEGQEESGGEVLFGLLEREPELTEADVVVVSDMAYYLPGYPAVYTGLRGICYAEITVRTAKADLHSGAYGGVAPNAHEALLRILAKLKAPSGRIRIPGFYDLVERPSKQILNGWKSLPFSETKFRKHEVRSRALTGLSRYTVLERLWALPTFEIHGISGGFTGEGAKTVIPSEAMAKVSLRLVPRQTASKVLLLLKKAVRELAPSYADVDIRSIHSGDPVLVNTDAPVFESLSRAFVEVEGRAPVLIRSGGSIPIVPELGKRGATMILTGIGLPDDGLHAPNEKLNLDQFYKGMEVFGRFFELLGEA